MRKILQICFPLIAIVVIYSCSSSVSKSHNVTVTEYDTVNDEYSNCSLTHLFFTTGFENNKLTVNWNNAVIYLGVISTDKIKGCALSSVTIPKNNCQLVVDVDNNSLSTYPGTEYCNMLFRKSGDTLFLLYTNRNPEFE